MNLTEMLLLMVPAVLVAFKLAALSLAATWALRAIFEDRALLPMPHRRVPQTQGRSLGSKV